MLIVSARVTAADQEAWMRAERVDLINAKLWRNRLATLAEQVAQDVRAFGGGCYAGCSWGKDSTALAHIIAAYQIDIPVVWVRVADVENPDCPLVRDAFLRSWRIDYHEIAVRHERSARRTSLPGFTEASRRFGDRHVSAVRGQESRARSLRMATYGVSTERTCAPLGHWTTAEVFAYLASHGLPVHPAYAQTMGGLLPREHLRVGALGGERGRGHGRREWEERYYGRELAAIEGIAK